MNLESIDVASLDIVTALPDVRRDLHVFVDYVRAHEVKRSHRENTLSKADEKRLARLMSDPDAEQEVLEDGFSMWIGFVDRMALRNTLPARSSQRSLAEDFVQSVSRSRRRLRYRCDL